VIRCGSNTLFDLDNYGLLAASREKLHTRSTESFASRALFGRLNPAEQATNAANLPSRVQCMFIPGTILNTACIIPCNQLSGNHIEVDLYLEQPSHVINSPSANAGYILSDLQIDVTYLFSPSLQSSVQSVNVDVCDYAFRYITMGQQRNVLKMNSAYSNLSSVELHIKDSAAVPTVVTNTGNKIERPISYADIEAIQVYANQRPLFPEISTGSQVETDLYDEAKKISQERIIHSSFYANYKGLTARSPLQPPLYLSFDSTPRFSEELQSGLHSARFGGDSGLYADITLKPGTVSIATQECFAFLKFTSKIYLSNGTLVREM
jgi:hypothetical protein